MNYDDLERAWNSPANIPDATQTDRLRRHFIGEHDRRRRGAKQFLFLVGAGLTALTIKFVVWAVRAEPGPEAFDFSREWGAALFLALPWIAFAGFAWRLARHDRDHGVAHRTVADSVRALLDDNRMALWRNRMVAVLHGVALVVLPVVVWQLRAAGKAGDEIILPAFVIWPVIAGGILFALWRHQRQVLQPRRRELEELLRDYERA